MGETKVGTPVTTPHGNHAELSNDNGGADGSRDFFGSLDTETDVALRVTNDDNGLEAGTLTGTGLLLDGLDLFRGKKNSKVRNRPQADLVDLSFAVRTFMTSSLSLGRKKSTIWYSLIGSE